jgi:hypothetical protein
MTPFQLEPSAKAPCTSTTVGCRPGCAEGWAALMREPQPGRGQERGQGGQQLLWSLLGNPMAGAGKDHALHVVGDELHRAGDPFTAAFHAADGQDGQGQPPGLSLLVLRDDGGERAVELEAAAQGVGA